MTALAMTAVTRIVYWRWSMMWFVSPNSANIGFSVALCLIAVWLGHLLAASFNQLRGA